jgi:thaumarchaeosortase
LNLRIEWLKKSWLLLTLLACFAAAIGLLMFLDYFNLEKIAFFNNTGFLFDYTWKGRLFLLFFVWLFALESFSSFKSLNEEQGKKRRNKLKLAAILAIALIPLIYVIGINFLGLDQVVVNLGAFIRLDYWKANWAYWENSLTGDWPMSLEYVVFTVSFLATVLLAYGKNGLKIFSISAALVAGIAVVYMIDTMYPAGAFKPFEALALPTAACAAVFLEVIGIRFTMFYQPAPSAAPIISLSAQGSTVQTGIAWPCAGVHSLFLFTIIILLLFKKSGITPFRQAIYFIIGAVGTYFVNIGRIVTYFVILINQGQDAALVFHNVYGEMYFFSWILVYILLIVGIQKYSLVERTKAIFHRNKLGSYSIQS